MSRLTLEERGALWDMFEAGVPFKKIGRQLGRQHSTVRAHIAISVGNVLARRVVSSDCP